MKQILAITIAALATLSAYSQVGYLGKKFSVGYNYEFTPWVSLTTRVNEYSTLSKGSRRPWSSRFAASSGWRVCCACLRKS